jgi:hypothetical protein
MFRSIFSYLPNKTVVDLFGKTSFLSTVSYVTSSFPRFTSPLMKIILKHVYGCHLDQLGTNDEGVAVQSKALSSAGTFAILVFFLYVTF